MRIVTWKLEVRVEHDGKYTTLVFPMKDLKNDAIGKRIETYLTTLAEKANQTQK